MSKDIKLQKNNDNRDWTDLEWIQEFYYFLQGHIPESINLSGDCKVHLTPEQSGAVIWYLQEHFPILPDNIEKCDNCNEMYDSHSEGIRFDIEGKNYCGACEHMSKATNCDCCCNEVFKSDAYDEDRGEYLCDECKVKKQD